MEGDMEIVSTILLFLFVIAVVWTWITTGENIWEIAWSFIAIFMVGAIIWSVIFG